MRGLRKERDEFPRTWRVLGDGGAREVVRGVEAVLGSNSRALRQLRAAPRLQGAASEVATLTARGEVDEDRNAVRGEVDVWREVGPNPVPRDVLRRCAERVESRPRIVVRVSGWGFGPQLA